MINKMLTEKEQLEYCKICQKKSFDMKVGIVCSITNTRRTFISSCEDFVENEQEAFKKNQKEKEFAELVEKAKTPDWKIALSVILGIIALIRLIIALR